MQSGSVETSAVHAVASPPAALMLATVRAREPSSIRCSPSFMVRAAHTTRAPSEAHNSETICPMPRLAPVTIATLPVSLPMVRFLWWGLGALSGEGAAGARRIHGRRRSQATKYRYRSISLNGPPLGGYAV